MTATATHGTYDTIVRQGKDFERVLGLSSWTVTAARAQLRTSPDAASATLSFSSPSSGLTISGGNEITWTITKTQTSALSPGIYLYDLFVTLTGGSERCLFAGQITVEKAITHG